MQPSLDVFIRAMASEGKEVMLTEAHESERVRHKMNE